MTIHTSRHAVSITPTPGMVAFEGDATPVASLLVFTTGAGGSQIPSHSMYPVPLPSHDDNGDGSQGTERFSPRWYLQ